MHNETTKMALHVITAVGYGYPFEWEVADHNLPPGHDMTFRDSIGITVDNIVMLIALPSWALKLPMEYFRKINKASKELRKYLHDIVDLGRDQYAELPDNTIISQLIAHSDTSENFKDRPLNDDEIMGNAFIFIMAGYETTYITYLHILTITVQIPCFTHFIN